jgi:hypothetical protein
VRVELQDESGRPIPGFALAGCTELVGDYIESAVRWSSGADLSPLAVRTVRLRFALKDADIFAMRFAAPESSV